MQKLIQHFEATILSQGGEIVEEAKSQRRSFLSMTLPFESTIQTGDLLSGGAAISIQEQKITLFPFFLRRICGNGMLAPTTLDLAQFEAEEIDRFVEALDVSLRHLRTNQLPEKNMAFRDSLNRPISMTLVQRVAQWMGGSFQPHAILRQLLTEVKAEIERPVNQRRTHLGMTHFDLVSGISSMAREHPDSAARWRWMRMSHDLLNGDLPLTESPMPHAASFVNAASRRRRRTASVS